MITKLQKSTDIEQITTEAEFSRFRMNFGTKLKNLNKQHDKKDENNEKVFFTSLKS